MIITELKLLYVDVLYFGFIKHFLAYKYFDIMYNRMESSIFISVGSFVSFFSGSIIFLFSTWKGFPFFFSLFQSYLIAWKSIWVFHHLCGPVYPRNLTLIPRFFWRTSLFVARDYLKCFIWKMATSVIIFFFYVYYFFFLFRCVAVFIIRLIEGCI